MIEIEGHKKFKKVNWELISQPNASVFLIKHDSVVLGLLLGNKIRIGIKPFKFNFNDYIAYD